MEKQVNEAVLFPPRSPPAFEVIQIEITTRVRTTYRRGIILMNADLGEFDRLASLPIFQVLCGSCVDVHSTNARFALGRL